MVKRRRIVDEDGSDGSDGSEESDADEGADDGGGGGEMGAFGGEEEGGPEEDLMESMEQDYAAIPELDQYDASLLDNRDQRELDSGTRRVADRLVDERRARRDGRLAEYLDDFGEEDESRRVRRRPTGRAVERGEDEDAGAIQEEEDVFEHEEINLEAMACPLREWIAQERTRREIKRRFRTFLTTYADESGARVYMERIAAMCANNLASFELSYGALSLSVPILAIWVADAPRDILEIFDEVANELVVCSELFPAYKTIKDEVYVRVGELPLLDDLRDLRQSHLNQLVRVSGVVTRRSGVFPQLKLVNFTCVRCGALVGPFKQSNTAEVKPSSCPTCQADGPFRLDQEETIYRNYQKLTIQEAPGAVPPGRVPRHKDVVLLADLIDVARPGEEIEVTGIYVHSYDTALSGRAGFPIFSTTIEANHVVRRNSAKSASLAISEDDRRKILKLSRDPKIAQRIISSLAPSIFGQRHAKRALALAIFGGCGKNVDGKHRIRGDINVLLLGDPGCAKSQLLKYSCQVVPRAVYTTGKGASAVGLTAGVHKDAVTKEWVLEGGALVLADNGICCIDEFDKMSEQDRTSIHEAMEQQSISVSKAGIVTSLQARCAVIAAANPIGGCYDSTTTFADNVELTDPILQRFDILCVLQDTADPVLDEQLARFVVGSHRRADAVRADDDEDTGGTAQRALPEEATEEQEKAPLMNDEEEETIPQDLLCKYVAHARETCRPRLHSIDQDKISRLYADLRRESSVCGGVPIAVRHLESLMRMAEAYAKMSLRDHVRDDDVDAAIAVLVASFIAAQKFSVRSSLERAFRKYLTSSADYFELLLHALRALVREAQIYLSLKRNQGNTDDLEVLMDDFEQKAREFNVMNLDDFYASTIFTTNGFRLDAQKRLIIWQGSY